MLNSSFPTIDRYSTDRCTCDQGSSSGSCSRSASRLQYDSDTNTLLLCWLGQRCCCWQTPYSSRRCCHMCLVLPSTFSIAEQYSIPNTVQIRRTIYINPRFTYLLTYLLTYQQMKQTVQYCVQMN